LLKKKKFAHIYVNRVSTFLCKLSSRILSVKIGLVGKELTRCKVVSLISDANAKTSLVDDL